MLGPIYKHVLKSLHNDADSNTIQLERTPLFDITFHLWQVT